MLAAVARTSVVDEVDLVQIKFDLFGACIVSSGNDHR
jgi:hypothetical protein